MNAFKIRWINVPQFGFEGCVGSNAFGFQLTSASNTFSVTLYDDGTGRDENEAQVFNPANPIGNNSVPFDEQEGPTDLRFALEPTTGASLVAHRGRREPGTSSSITAEWICWERKYSR